MSKRLVLIACTLLALGGPVRAEDSARAWLERMATAVAALNYDGVYIYHHGPDLEAMRIVHIADGEHTRERLVSLTGPAREVIRDNDQVTCYLPDKKAVMVEKTPPKKPFPATLPDDLSRLDQAYELVLQGEDRVAGQPARVVMIKPRDRYRYGYRLWLHADNALPLKSDLLDDKGRVVEQVMFTELKLLDDPAAAELDPAVKADGFAWHHTDPDATAEAADKGYTSAWQVAQLPAGFEMLRGSQHPMPDGKQPVEHLVYSDGLASVSVYIEPATGKRKHLRGKSRMGAVNAFGTRIADQHVTVVGEVPVATVKLIGESVRRTATP